MITPEIIAYIKAEKAKNTADDLIKTNLLDNGWHEQDIAEAMVALKTDPTYAALPLVADPVTLANLKKYRNKRTWITFTILAVTDIMIILYMGGRGVFGISPLSIIMRIIVIYGIASFASIGSKEKKSTLHTTIDIIARSIASVAIAIMIIFGVLFLYCLFALSHSSI